MIYMSINYLSKYYIQCICQYIISQKNNIQCMCLYIISQNIIYIIYMSIYYLSKYYKQCICQYIISQNIIYNVYFNTLSLKI